tara:strand:- start:4702 stop:5406 length:705 start_codon:yes stop_codon:yes gene_type:complete
MKNINQSKNSKVNNVFNTVFSKYDLMNDLMSFGVHRIWKKKLLDWIKPSKDLNFLDMSSGTGDVAKAFLESVNNEGKVICVDPNINMIKTAKKKMSGFKNVDWICAAAEKLPIKSETVDIYVVSFGIRNFQDINKSLKEALRVLKPGGRFVCLEFSKVENEFAKKIYKYYSKTIPFIGKQIIGNSEPYEYLIKSIENFYSQEELKNIIMKNGFFEVEYRNLSGGIVAIHSGWKI